MIIGPAWQCCSLPICSVHIMYNSYLLAFNNFIIYGQFWHAVDRGDTEKDEWVHMSSNDQNTLIMMNAHDVTWRWWHHRNGGCWWWSHTRHDVTAMVDAGHVTRRQWHHIGPEWTVLRMNTCSTSWRPVMVDCLINHPLPLCRIILTSHHSYSVLLYSLQWCANVAKGI